MAAIDRLTQLDAVARLTARDASLFSDDSSVQADVTNRIGWTTLAADAAATLPAVRQLAQEAADLGVADVVLLGMGGSSLASLVMGSVLPHAHTRLHVLDTVSPVTVSRVLDAVDPATTLVLVSSKSGGTIEPNALYAVFRGRFDEVLGRDAAGRRFVAITDPGSSLENLAAAEGFLTIVPSPPTVGGRFSALTTFGLVPAALIGADLDRLIAAARTMEDDCAETDLAENPAVELAGFIADAHAAGRDKLTVVASKPFASFGLWVEQLVAESLGKHGTGVVPVVELAIGLPGSYGTDRAVVVLRQNGDERLAGWAQAQRGALPVHEVLVGDAYDLSGEFVRWEYAIALAGVLLGVNPFDEPNVAEAKAATAAVLEGGAEPIAPQMRLPGGIDVTFADGLSRPEHHEHTVATALGHAIAALDEGDYLAILAYLPDDEALLAPLREAVPRLAEATGSAVALELGPRYLHSTGQLHKGGPNTGVFVIVTNDDPTDIAVPGKPWSLKALHRAQAEGDLATLVAHERRSIRVDLPDASAESIESFAGALLDAAGVVREVLTVE